MPTDRNISLSIVKAAAIILMVAGHTEGPWWLTNFIYLFHMPVFFIAAGYFWKRVSVDAPWEFCAKRFRKLYVPMVVWSVVFLLLHNFWFDIGMLNETYGNLQGGVTHPYSLKTGLQRLVNIITAMAGYDEFLAGAFWFFRALLVSSILFMIFHWLIDKRKKMSAWIPPTIIVGIVLAFTALKIGYGLKVVNIVQGGIRECWGIMFFAIGVIYRHFEDKIPRWWWTNVVYAGVLIVGAWQHWAGMNLTPRMIDLATLPVTGICGFLLLHNAARALASYNSPALRFLAYVGDNTLPIFVLHIICFKAAAAIQIAAVGLDWQMIGCHMVVHHPTTAAGYWLLYTVAGVVLPLLLDRALRRIKLARFSK